MNVMKSGRRGSNPRQRRWQRRALPTELRPHITVGTTHAMIADTISRIFHKDYT